MSRVICDTNILIGALNGKHEAIEIMRQIQPENVVLSAITVMELYQGMGDKNQLAWMKKQIRYYDILHFTSEISKKAIELVHDFKLSHGLEIPDAIIAATAIHNQLPLATFNKKDFQFIPNVLLLA
jgi:predicted nucleic acid-binding protein